MGTLLIKNGTIVTMNKSREIFQGDIFIENDRIKEIGMNLEIGNADKVIDATGNIVIPGLIQAHIHLTQTIFRGQADDLVLMDWLKKRIWPLEASHDEESNYYSAQLGLAEVISCGTTSIIDMETVNHTDVAIDAIYKSGLRAITGKCMMDYSTDVPAGLQESTEDSIENSIKLLKKWHMKDNGRIRYAFTPRFAVSCTEDLMKRVGVLAREYGVHVHTHASESTGEIAIVKKLYGMKNVEFLHKIGLTGPNVILAHCIWLDEEEMRILKDTETKIVHCPSCNMKLASGIAKIPEMLAKDMNVSIGADGAPCNNNLDIFREMRTAALIQKVRLMDPTALPAADVFEMATLGGAKAMGLENEIGSLETGKKADIAIIDFSSAHTTPSSKIDIVSHLVYACNGSDVLSTIVDGKVLMENKKLLTLDFANIRENCNRIILTKAQNIID